ncbi:MAG: hypothetical protein R3F02_04715 [Thiolinea sp.]
MKKKASVGLLVSPVRLFMFAQAFRFSSGRGQCFSPGIKSLLVWHSCRIRRFVLDRAAAKWWRVWLEKV